MTIFYKSLQKNEYKKRYTTTLQTAYHDASHAYNAAVPILQNSASD